MIEYWNSDYGASPLSCCAIYGLYNFPYDNEWDEDTARRIPASIEDHEREAARLNKSVVLVSLNSHQKRAKKMLKKLGFKATPAFLRPVNPRDSASVCLLYKQVSPHG